MKLTTVLASCAFLLASNMAVQAQDQKSGAVALQQEHSQIKDHYEQQKSTIEASYKTEMSALKAQTNLTPAQRKEQRMAIQKRYNEQKRSNQEAYEVAKGTLKTDRKETREDRKENRIKPDQKPAKMVHPVKTPRPMKH